MGVEWREKYAKLFTVQPPPHPTYDLEAVIQLALDEDSGGIGCLSSLSTVPAETQAVATFLAKDSGILAGKHLDAGGGDFYFLTLPFF